MEMTRIEQLENKLFEYEAKPSLTPREQATRKNVLNHYHELCTKMEVEPRY